MKIHEQLRINGFVRVVDELGPEEDDARRKQFEIRRLTEQNYIATVTTRTRKVRAFRNVTRAELESLLYEFENTDTADFNWRAGNDELPPWEFYEVGHKLWVNLLVPAAKPSGRILIKVSAEWSQWAALIENLKEELR